MTSPDPREREEPRRPNQHDAYCPSFGSEVDHAGLCREQAGYPVTFQPDWSTTPSTADRPVADRSEPHSARVVLVDLYDAACLAMAYMADPEGLTFARARYLERLTAAIQAANPIVGPLSDESVR